MMHHESSSDPIYVFVEFHQKRTSRIQHLQERESENKLNMPVSLSYHAAILTSNELSIMFYSTFYVHCRDWVYELKSNKSGTKRGERRRVKP